MRIAYVPQVPRARDEDVLDNIALKRAGYSWAQIARMKGRGRSTAIATECARVRAADRAHCGDDVLGAYW